jgi:2'-5' RNA ligase
MTAPADASQPTLPRGGLIVPFLEVEPLIEPLLEQYLPVWNLGVPAHVTLLFPFPTSDQLDAAALADLTSLFAATPAITARLVDIGLFPDMVYLAPEPRDWFISLTRALSARFGLLPYGGQHAEIVPHLSVSRQTDPAVQAEIARALRSMLPIETAVREVWLMDEEQDGHWHRAATFPLGPAVAGHG